MINIYREAEWESKTTQSRRVLPQNGQCNYQRWGASHNCAGWQRCAKEKENRGKPGYCIGWIETDGWTQKSW